MHNGFQKAVEAVYSSILSEVKSLKKAHSGYKVKVTGHSLGGALAQLTAMALQKDGIAPAQMINFGQPRVGDDTYASFSKSKLSNQFRVTHNKDSIPHLPTTVYPPYHHVAIEQYENSNGNVKQCNKSGEDPSCADQWQPWQYNVADHLVYLGI